jgi:hypothetical protein
MNRYIAELAATDPIAAEAVNELSILASQGQFFGLSATVEQERLEEVFANGRGYWLGQVSLYNAEPDLTAKPDLNTIIFFTHGDDPARLAFLQLFQQHVAPWQWAIKEVKAQQAADSDKTGFMANHDAFEQTSMLEPRAG